jgi:hypothetical protein
MFFYCNLKVMDRKISLRLPKTPKLKLAMTLDTLSCILVDAALAELARWINAGGGNAHTIRIGADIIVGRQIGRDDLGSAA